MLTARRRRSLAHDKRGLAALEFALIMPIMVTMLLGVVDTTRALTAWRQITSVAQASAEIATAAATLASDGNYQLTPDQVYAASTAIYAFMPALKSGSDRSQFAVTVSAVAFTGVVATNGCAANTPCTAWSVVGSYDTAETAQTLPNLLRPCGAQTQVATGTSPTLTTLPTLQITGVTSLLVTDVLYQFKPLFFLFFTGPINMRREAYLPARVGSATTYIEYNGVATGNAGYSKVCPGYL